MEENTQLPKEVVDEIEKEAEAHNNLFKEHAESERDVAYAQGFAEGWHDGATAYAAKLHQANEVIKVLEYDNNKLKGEVEGYKNAVDELRTKYDNILATESGHESKTENVWQSGYAAGHEAGYERGKREAQPGAVWVKASDRLPVKGGKENSVIVRGVFKESGYNEWPFVAYGYRNFNPEKQQMYFELGSKSYLTNDVEWLDESAAGREDAVELIKYIRENYKPSKEVWKDKFGIALLSDEGVLSMYKQQKEK